MQASKIILLLMLFLSLSIKAQDKQEEHSALLLGKSNRYYGYNLKGSVKSIRFTYNSVRNDISKYDSLNRIILKNDIKQNKFVEFNKQGLIIKSDYNKKITYENEDVDKKSQHILKRKQKYPAYDYVFLLKPDRAIYNEEDISYEKYEYEFDSIGRIKSEKKYYNFSEYDNINKGFTDENLLSIINFFYDSHNNVLYQKIIPGKWAKGMSYNVFGTETPFCKDTRIDYSYDEKDRLIKVILFSCNTIIFEEDYTYAFDGYISEVYSHFSGLSGYPSTRMKAYYNKNGDIIHMHFITIDNEIWLGDEAANRYYEYEYDSYGNWIKCRLYLEGKKEGEPSTIAVRKIEYYD